MMVIRPLHSVRKFYFLDYFYIFGTGVTSPRFGLWIGCRGACGCPGSRTSGPRRDDPYAMV